MVYVLFWVMPLVIVVIVGTLIGISMYCRMKYGQGRRRGGVGIVGAMAVTHAAHQQQAGQQTVIYHTGHHPQPGYGMVQPPPYKANAPPYQGPPPGGQQVNHPPPGAPPAGLHRAQPGPPAPGQPQMYPPPASQGLGPSPTDPAYPPPAYQAHDQYSGQPPRSNMPGVA